MSSTTPSAVRRARDRGSSGSNAAGSPLAAAAAGAQAASASSPAAAAIAAPVPSGSPPRRRGIVTRGPSSDSFSAEALERELYGPGAWSSNPLSPKGSGLIQPTAGPVRGSLGQRTRGDSNQSSYSAVSTSAGTSPRVARGGSMLGGNGNGNGSNNNLSVVTESPPLRPSGAVAAGFGAPATSGSGSGSLNNSKRSSPRPAASKPLSLAQQEGLLGGELLMGSPNLLRPHDFEQHSGDSPSPITPSPREGGAGKPTPPGARSLSVSPVRGPMQARKSRWGNNSNGQIQAHSPASLAAAASPPAHGAHTPHASIFDGNQDSTAGLPRMSPIAFPASPPVLTDEEEFAFPLAVARQASKPNTAASTPKPQRPRSIDLTASQAIPHLSEAADPEPGSAHNHSNQDTAVLSQKSSAKSAGFGGQTKTAFGSHKASKQVADDTPSPPPPPPPGGGSTPLSSIPTAALSPRFSATSDAPLAAGPIDRASLWTTMTLGFLNPILAQGRKHTLQRDDVPLWSREDAVPRVVQVFSRKWNTFFYDTPGAHAASANGRPVTATSRGANVRAKVSSPLMRTLLACYGWRWVAGAVATVIGRWGLILTPLLIKEFLVWSTIDTSLGRKSGTQAGFILEWGSSDLSYGGYIVGALVFMMILASVTVNHAYYQGVRIGCAFRTALMSLIYEKALRCSNFARVAAPIAAATTKDGKKPAAAAASGGGTGQTVNLMANDTQQIFDASTFLHFVWVEPMLILGTVAVMYWQIGLAALAAGFLMLILFPVQVSVARKIGRNRAAMVKQTDARVKILSEILQGIRVIKLYAWELPMAEKIQEVRLLELACVRRALLLKSFNLLTLFLWPAIVSMVTFIVYVALGNDLTVIKSITILAFVNVLARPITVLPMSLIAVAEVRVSMARIEKFLLAEELQRVKGTVGADDQESDSGLGEDEDRAGENTNLVEALPSVKHGTNVLVVSPKPTPTAARSGGPNGAAHKANIPSTFSLASSVEMVPRGLLIAASTPSSHATGASGNKLAIEIRDGSFAWERSGAPTLAGVEFTVKKGALVGVIGSVGAGKSSLLSAILGEMHPIRGSVRVHGRIAYMAQQAWIQNCTVRDNILFHSPYDPARYAATLEAACLTADLANLPAGDMTEIGERGITMSGGQKSRVSLARAVYRASMCDLYLLDDPFAAVDVHVGTSMFHESVAGILRGKTRVVVLNSHLHLLKHFDEVVVVEASEQRGNVGSIVARGTFAQMERLYPALLAQEKLRAQIMQNEDEAEAAAAIAEQPGLPLHGGLNEIKEEESSSGGRLKTATTRASQTHRTRASQGGSTEFYMPSDGVGLLSGRTSDIFIPSSDGPARSASPGGQLLAGAPVAPPVSGVSGAQFRSAADAALDADDPDNDTAVFGKSRSSPKKALHVSHASQSFVPLNRTGTYDGDTPHDRGGGASFAAGHHAYKASMSGYPHQHNRQESDAGLGTMVGPPARGTTFSIGGLQSTKKPRSVGVADSSSPSPVASPNAGKRSLFPPPKTPKSMGAVSPNAAMKRAAAAAGTATAPPVSMMTKEDRASGSVGFNLYRWYADMAALSHVPDLLDVEDAPLAPAPVVVAPAATNGDVQREGNGLGSITAPRNGTLARATTLQASTLDGGAAAVHTNGGSKSSTPSDLGKDKDKLEKVEKQDSPHPPLPPPEEPIQLDIDGAAHVVSTTWAGFGILLSVLLLFLVCQAVRIACDLFLTYWGQREAAQHQANTEGRYHDSRSENLLFWGVGCAILASGTFLLVGFRAWLFVKLGLRISDRMHRLLFRKLLLAPITTFYDVTPLGRILNRFSKDFDQVDSFLPDLMSQLLQHSFNLAGGLILSALSTQWFLIVLVPIFYLFGRLQTYFRLSSRELKRLEGVTRSPIFSMFGETLLGLSTIRAFRSEQQFIALQRRNIAANANIYTCFYLTSRWLSLRLDFISNFLVLAVGLFGIFLKESIDPALIGLALLYTLQFTGFLQWTVRVSVDTENSMTSVERLSQYTFLPAEAPYVVPASRAAPERWPSKGAIVFNDLKMRYRPELPWILKGVSCSIQPREKIGICGRTGSGKSSLMVSLFRIVEAPNRGSILIDGIDIATVGLLSLRSGLSIIPQDPVLFSGTIRLNLDPFHQRTDEQLWVALAQVSLKGFVLSQPQGLESNVAEYGDNFSSGQKQLICIARALLRQSKIIVLDEATAAVDNQTDALIQKTIRESFADCTVLTIAHRLNTIMDSTRILVLDNGYLAEFDTPHNLLQNKNGIFANMVASANTNKGDAHDAEQHA